MNPIANEVEALLSAKEIASRWHICTKTVRRLVDRGVLHAVPLSSRCLRFKASDVAAALARMSGAEKCETMGVS